MWYLWNFGLHDIHMANINKLIKNTIRSPQTLHHVQNMLLRIFKLFCNEIKTFRIAISFSVHVYLKKKSLKNDSSGRPKRNPWTSVLHKFAQDKSSPFSQLRHFWMSTECSRNVNLNPDFRHCSVPLNAAEWQAHFSDHFF